MNTFILLFLSILYLNEYSHFYELFSDNVHKKTTTNTLLFQLDSAEIELYQVVDSDGIPLYYYKEINQFPCETERVCDIMILRMYWDALGNYLVFELQKDHPLTKINHEPFTDDDYHLLHKILNNPYSELQFCANENLTTEECEKQYFLDATTGATSEDITFEHIEGAIKTTYSLWNISHGKIADTIKYYTQVNLTFGFANDTIQTLAHLIDQDNLITEELLTQYKSYIANADNTTLTFLLQYLKTLGIQETSSKDVLLSAIENSVGLRYLLLYNILQQSGFNTDLYNKKISFFKPISY